MLEILLEVVFSVEVGALVRRLISDLDLNAFDAILFFDW
jgi:hypothetical protein